MSRLRRCDLSTDMYSKILNGQMMMGGGGGIFRGNVFTPRYRRGGGRRFSGLFKVFGKALGKTVKKAGIGLAKNFGKDIAKSALESGVNVIKGKQTVKDAARDLLYGSAENIISAGMAAGKKKIKSAAKRKAKKIGATGKRNFKNKVIKTVLDGI